MGKTLDPQHDFSHVQRVMENALKIVDVLNLENKIDINILKIACLFHDIAFTQYKPSFLTWILEGKYSVRILRELNILFFLNKKEISLVEQAIRYHGLAFPLRRLNRKRSLYCQILQDADMLDQFSQERIENLRKPKKKSSFFCYVIHALHKPALRFARKNIRFFLNFPQLAKNFHC